MKIKLKENIIITTKEIEWINITNIVKEFVINLGIKDGLVFIMSKHTTTAITVNEGLVDLESDITKQLEQIVPEDMPYYRHSRYLHSDGQMAINSHSHIRGSLLGFEVFFPIKDGEIVSGKRQNVYFVELDGPQERTYVLQAIGE